MTELNDPSSAMTLICGSADREAEVGEQVSLRELAEAAVLTGANSRGE
jgi:hypothetical protein